MIAQSPTVLPVRRPFGSQDTSVVEITAKELGKVSTSGQYIPAEGGRALLNQEFTLQRVNRQWRIATLPTGGVNQPSSELLLTKDLFQLDYQPRNLYYLDPAGKGRDLVPDPVFVPVDSSDPAADLVRALLVSPAGWLRGAVLSAFPPAAALAPDHPVQILPGSKTAVVALSMPKSATSRVSLAQMASQLVWTLTSSSYGSRGDPGGQAGGQRACLDSARREQRGAEPPCLPAARARAARAGGPVLPGQQRRGARAQRQDGSRAAPGQAGTGQVPLTSIAVSRDRRYLAGVGGTTLYTTSLAAAAKPHASESARALQTRMTGTAITSVSWDRSDHLWVTGSSGGKPRVWILGPSGDKRIVGLPPNIRSVTALRVAPDGVRVAMIASVEHPRERWQRPAEGGAAGRHLPVERPGDAVQCRADRRGPDPSQRAELV